MANVSEDSLKSGGFSPNLYVRRISISQGASIKSSKTLTSENGNFIRYRRDNGTLTYRSTNSEAPFKDGSTQVALEIQVKDVIDQQSGKGFWLTDYQGRSRSVMYILQSTNPKLTEELLDGRLFDSPNSQVPARYKNLIDYEIKELSLAFTEAEKSEISNATNDPTGNRVSSLNRSFVFQVPDIAPSHLTYFAFVKSSSQSNRRRRYTPHSMIAVEKVFEEGQIVDQAFVFRDVENLIWAGPVHLHPEQGWMEGAFHIDAPHDALQRVGINNFKIRDERAFALINEPEIDLGRVVNTRSEVSDAYVSRSPNNEATMMFTFDHLSYMIENSKYGKLYANSSPRLQSELLRRSRITNLSILRKRVVPRDSVNSLESADKVLYDFSDEKPPEVLAVSADEGGVLLAQSRYVVDGPEYNKFKDLRSSAEPPSDYKFYGSIQELAVERIGRKRTFAIKDGAISRVSDGKYVYEAQIEIEDAAFEFLQGRLSSFNKMLELMTNYLQLARNNRNFNSKTGEFTSSFISSQRVRSEAVPVWLGSIISLVEAMDLLTEVSTEDKSRLANALYILLNPELGILGNLEKYVTSLEIFGQRFENAITGRKAAHTRDRSSIAQSSARTRIVNNFTFTQVFDANVTHNTGFEYIKLSDDLSLSVSEFTSRIDSELARYNKDVYDSEELQKNFDFISKEDADALVATNTRYSHIAPKFFKVINTIVDLLSENKDSLDFTSVTAVIQAILDNPANRELDVYIERDAIGLLRKAGTGPTTERTEGLANVLQSAAADDGIYVEDTLERSILKVDPRAASQAESLSSEEYLGSNNKFSSATNEIPANTARPAIVQSTRALSVLQELYRFKNEPTDKNKPQSESLENISFDLARNDNFINKRLRPELQPATEPVNPKVLSAALQDLPEQIKLLTRSKGRIYNDSSAMSTTITDSQTDAFVYNFSMIRVVEYLAGYEDEDARRPIWKVLNSDIINSSRSNLLCRIRSYLDSSTNIGAFDKILDIPVYGEHFILSASRSINPSRVVELRQRELSSSALEIGFKATSYTRGPEANIARRLVSFGNQVREIGAQTEFISSSITGAPTSSTRRLSGASEPTSATTPAETQPQEEVVPRSGRSRTAARNQRTPNGGRGY